MKVKLKKLYSVIIVLQIRTKRRRSKENEDQAPEDQDEQRPSARRPRRMRAKWMKAKANVSQVRPRAKCKHLYCMKAKWIFYILNNGISFSKWNFYILNGFFIYIKYKHKKLRGLRCLELLQYPILSCLLLETSTFNVMASTTKS